MACFRAARVGGIVGLLYRSSAIAETNLRATSLIHIINITRLANAMPAFGRTRAGHSSSEIDDAGLVEDRRIERPRPACTKRARSAPSERQRSRSVADRLLARAFRSQFLRESISATLLSIAR